MSNQTGERPFPLLKVIAERPAKAAYVLIGAAVLFGIIPIVTIYRHGWDFLSVSAWGTSLALIAGAGAVWLLAGEQRQEKKLDNARLLVLGMGGVAGLVTTLMGLALVRNWWDLYLSTWLQAGEGKEPWRVGVVLLAVVGGLGLMFTSLQLGRTEERTNPGLRRLLYGYNAVLTGLLLLGILAVANLMAYLKLPQAIDFTASSIYSLSDRSRSILQGLKEPVQAYVIMTQDTFLLPDTETLLRNCEDVSPNFKWKVVSPDLSEKEVENLRKRYPKFEERLGILLTSGDNEHRFIRMADLFDERAVRGSDDSKPAFKFTGEDRIMTEIQVLQEGGGKKVLYFTQGNGEMEIRDGLGGQRGQAISLKERLQRDRNYEVKPLLLGGTDTSVPDDAAAVIMLNPSATFPDVGVQALRSYMDGTANKPGGKLLVFLDPPSPTAAAQANALETYLRDLNVQAGKDRLLTLRRRAQFYISEPTEVLVRTNPDLPDNPIVRGFRQELFTLDDVRSIRPGAGAGPAGKYLAQPLLIAPEGQGVVVETDLKALPDDVIDREHIEFNARRPGRRSKDPVPVAVVVSESEMPSDPREFHRGPSAGRPRAVVAGTSQIAGNAAIDSRSGGFMFDLVASMIDWVNERPTGIGIEAKQREFFKLRPSDSDAVWPMILMPGFIMMLGVVGLGTGIWVVRRR